MGDAYFLGVQRVDSRKEGLCPLQPAAKRMIDSKTISDAPIIMAFGPPLLDLV